MRYRVTTTLLLLVLSGPRTQAGEPSLGERLEKLVPRAAGVAQVEVAAKKLSPSAAELDQVATAIRPSAKANKWQQIPWLMDVNEGRRLAKEEKRPLFLWTVFGEPLDEC